MHLSKTPEGTWRAIVQVNGNRRSVIRPTRAEVEFAAAQLRIEMGGLPRPTDLTVGSIVHAYIADKETTWSPTTYADRTAAVKLIPKAFLDRAASSVTVPVVLALWRQMAAAGVTPHRVHRAGSVLGSAMAAAIRAGTIPPPNAFHLSPAPAPPKAEISVPAVSVVRALLAADEVFGLFLRVAATTGARRGEICAMRWDDIDLGSAGNDEQTDRPGDWRVSRRIVQVAGQPVTELAGTKTGSKGLRRLTLDVKTCRLLVEWKAAQIPPAELLLPEPVYVFSLDHGNTPVSPNAMTNRFDHLRQKTPGAEAVRMHDLRHYVATSMLEDGVSPHDVANQLGHASTSTTLNVYGHFIPGRNRDAMTRLAGRLD